MSVHRNIQNLKEVVNNVLNLREQTEFAKIINRYYASKNVGELVKSITALLDTPAKRQIVKKLRRILPRSHVLHFDRLIEQAGSRRKDRPEVTDDTYPDLGQRRNGVDSSRHKNHPAASLDLYSSKPPTSEAGIQNGEIKRVRIDRSSDDFGRGLGLGIRGGAEHGLGIYVSSVDEDSPADRQCLKAGDQIISVNGISLKKLTNTEAVKIIKSSRRLDMEVCHVGRIPGAFETHQKYVWADSFGRTTSPPPEVNQASNRYESTGGRKSGLMLLQNIDEKKVNLSIGGSRALGIKMRGGNEFGLGIYISGVDERSSAANAGLKVGDQILDVNGISFLDISHSKAVRVLKSSKRLMMTVKDVGKIPYAMTTYDQTEWITDKDLAKPVGSLRSKVSSRSGILDSTFENEDSVFIRGLGSQLMLNSRTGQSAQLSVLERQAMRVLNDDELVSMKYCLKGYQDRNISVKSLVVALAEIFDSKRKISLFNEVRGLILPRDLDDYDLWIREKCLKYAEKYQPLSSPQFFPLRDTWAVHSLSSIASSVSSYRYNSAKASGDEMDPLRKAIEEIFDDVDETEFDNFRPIPRSKPPKLLFPKNSSHSTKLSPNGNGISVVADVHRPAGRHQPEEEYFIQNDKNHVDKAVETSEDVFENGDLHLNSTNQRNKATDTAEQLEDSLEILPYYAEIHLRSVNRDQYHPQMKMQSPGTTVSTQTEVVGLSDSSDESEEVRQSMKYRGPGSRIRARRGEMKPLETVYEANHQGNGGTTDGEESNAEDVNGYYHQEAVHYGQFSAKENPLFGNPRPHSAGTDPPSNSGRLKIVPSKPPRTTKTPKPKMADTFDIVDDGDDSLVATNDVENWVLHRRNPDPIGREFSQTSPAHDDATINVEIVGNDNNREIVFQNGDDATRSNGLRANGLTPNGLSPNGLTPNGLQSNGFRMNGLGSDEPTSIFNKPDISRTSHHLQTYESNIPSLRFRNQKLKTSAFSKRTQQSKISSSGINSSTHSASNGGFRSSASSVKPSEDFEEINSEVGFVPSSSAKELQEIKIFKSKPTLGIAIEGGANTRQPMPRVAKIQDHGSAYATDLQEGHILVEADGKSMFGLEHKECAQLIADCFRDKSLPYLTLTVLRTSTHQLIV